MSVETPTAPAVASKPSLDLKIVQDATCTFCGCVCDDIDLSVQGNKIIEAKRACVLGKAWFLNHHIENEPDARINGQPASYEQAIERAAEILSSAHYPVTYGLSDTTCEAQRVAVAISDWIGGMVDTTTSVCHGPSGMAFQGVGEVTSTLGEIRNRADYLLFWGGNPAESHPRHFTKYSLMPKSEELPNGRKDRTAVLIDVRKTKSSKAVDLFLQIKPRSDFELAWAWRLMAKGLDPDKSVEAKTGISIKILREVMDGMIKAKYGAILFGMGVTMTRGKHFNSGAVLALARDMNKHTRWVAKPMRGHGNVTGADNVVTWSTGYPFGVNLCRGYPRFNPGEFTTSDLLARGEADAAMIIASDPMSNFSQPARDHLKSIPVITLDPKMSETARIAAVAFTTATYGINTTGTVYRMDDVPLPLRPAFESPYKSDYEILKMLEKRVREKLAEKKGVAVV